MAIKIIGCGGYLPSKIVNNFDLEKTIDTSDEWIRSRTGITQRHIADEDELVSDMAFRAAEIAIKDAKIEKEDIDLIITSTNTADHCFPSAANKVQGYFNLPNIPSFDLQAICSGFLYGLQVATSMMSSNKYSTVLLICADKMSNLVDWQDRKTCVLFGDGAGAVILKNTNAVSGLIDCNIYSDGSKHNILYTSGGIGLNKGNGSIIMNGQEVYRLATQKMSESISSILKKNNLTADKIDHFVPHQANWRIIKAVAKKFDIAEDKIAKTITKHANCSAASIPLALFDLKKQNKLKDGDLIAFTSFGAGTTWGASLIYW